MNTALAKLTSSIENNLVERRTALQPVEAVDFSYLKVARTQIDKQFGGAEAALEPPIEKRRIALGKFRLMHPLTQSEWRMVFAGLSDSDGINTPLLDDDQLFVRVHQEVSNRINEKNLSRRDWLSLCFSYFGYESHEPACNANWQTLRRDIDEGFDAVKTASAKEREWMRIVEQYREIFSDRAGEQLAAKMFVGEIEDLSSLQTIAQINDSSWLWRRIFTVLMSRIFMIDDDEFLEHLPGLLKLGQHHVRYLNEIISACLTRYYQSKHRDNPDPSLKQISLEQWGSPQIRSRQNSWLQYVEKPVCAMVAAWFAKEDLEHFFSLLQGDKQVDQSRLFYWLRFSNQMSYTRIVMGVDALAARGRDFIQFREKNKGRLSYLTGAPRHISAVIMQIGSYFFVEFSGTGNACYIYKADSAPFNPDKQYLALDLELKRRDVAKKWLLHSPAPSRSKRVEGWLVKFDDELRRLGISPQSKILPEKASKVVNNNKSAHTSDEVIDILDKYSEISPLEEQVKAALNGFYYTVLDYREKGGSFKVKLAKNEAAAISALLRLGFKKVNNQPLLYWRE